jgi:hypothetical protein
MAVRTVVVDEIVVHLTAVPNTLQSVDGVTALAAAAAIASLPNIENDDDSEDPRKHNIVNECENVVLDKAIGNGVDAPAPHTLRVKCDRMKTSIEALEPSINRLFMF